MERNQLNPLAFPRLFALATSCILDGGSGVSNPRFCNGTHSFIDLYKIGKLNYVKGCTIAWRDYTLREVCFQIRYAAGS